MIIYDNLLFIHLYPTNEIKKEKLIVVLVSGLIAMTASYFGMTAQFSPSLADASSFMTTFGIEYDIHNSNLTGVCDEEDTAVRLSTRTEKILVYSALAIIIIVSYAYAASVPPTNAPGGFDYIL